MMRIDVNVTSSELLGLFLRADWSQRTMVEAERIRWLNEWEIIFLRERILNGEV
jgi:hypothetical protein